jgi:hypothetical protein
VGRVDRPITARAQALASQASSRLPIIRRFLRGLSAPPFLFRSQGTAIVRLMTDAADRLTPATPDDLASALAFALRFEGRKRTHYADEIMAEIVAKRLERAGFVVMKRPAQIGGAALGRGHGG